MAIRYVKDFEFPSAAGYSDSKPSKVTGPMFAKGGKVEKAPKDNDYSVTGIRTVTQSEKKEIRSPQPTDFGWSAEQMERAERGYKKGGKVAKVMHEFGAGELHSGSKKGPTVTNPKQAIAIALSEQRAAKKSHGGKIESVPVKDIKSGKVKQSTDEDYYGKAKPAPMPQRRPSMLKKGGMPHEDVKEDRALIKSMVKPDALKKADGGGIGLAAPRMASPLQQMARKAVPVAPRAPMIAPQAAAPGGQRIGVNATRPGQPNVGAIRAAMARRVSQAMPENAPAVMKKGGKVGC